MSHGIEKMLSLKSIARLVIAMMLSLLVIGSAFSLGPQPCTATSPGPVVKMYEKPHTQSAVVNSLTVDDHYLVVDITKVPSELEPEGAYALWLLLKPTNGTARGWVPYGDVIVSGDTCYKFGL